MDFYWLLHSYYIVISRQQKIDMVFLIKLILKHVLLPLSRAVGLFFTINKAVVKKQCQPLVAPRVQDVESVKQQAGRGNTSK